MLDKIAALDQQIEKLQQEKRLLELQVQIKGEEAGYECCNPNHRKVVIIGGCGQLGQIFFRLFEASGYQVNILEKENWHQSQQLFENASLVLVAVPIHFTQQIIQRLSGLSENCVVADITSIKTMPLAAMLTAHAGSVVGLHPMFGPDVKDTQGQTIIVCHGRDAPAYQWLLNQFNVWQAKLHFVSAEQHDQTMAFVQVLRHFSTVVYGAHLAHEGVSLPDILAMSSPIYRLELAMVGRLFAQKSELYTEIIFANPNNIAMMQRYCEQFNRLLQLLENNDKQAFMQEFAQTSNWFGDYATQFLQESSLMLNGVYAQAKTTD